MIRLKALWMRVYRSSPVNGPDTILFQTALSRFSQTLADQTRGVGHLYLVDGHKTPLRKRSNGRGRIEAGQEASLFAFFGRPRRFGATKGGGGMRKVSTYSTLQR